MKKVIEILADERLLEMQELSNFDEESRILYNKIISLHKEITKRLNDFKLFNEYEETMTRFTGLQLKKYYIQGYSDGAGK